MTTPLFEVAPVAGNGCSVPDQLKPKPRTVTRGALLFEDRVYGTPAPQGSKRAMPIYRGKGANKVFTGKVYMEESGKENLDPWRSRVASTTTETYGHQPPLDEALLVEMVFTAVRPKGHYRTGRNASLLREGAPPRPTSKPDVSKLARAVEDAITDAGVWRDDSRVVEYLRLAKVYAGEDVDALESPGVLIRIYQIGATS